MDALWFPEHRRQRTDPRFYRCMDEEALTLIRLCWSRKVKRATDGASAEFILKREPACSRKAQVKQGLGNAKLPARAIQ